MGDNAAPSRFSLARRLDAKPSHLVSGDLPMIPSPSETRRPESRPASIPSLWLAFLHPARPQQVAERLQGFHRIRSARIEHRLRLQRRCGVCPPLQRQLAEDKPRARQVIGARNHLCRVPAVTFHDARRITAVLDGVLGLSFLKDGGCWNPLGFGRARHYDRFNGAILSTPPLRMSLGATPRSYSCTASVTRAS